MNLRGCVALVTGASRTGQAGEAVAAALLREGACLVLAARHAEGLRQVADGLAAPAGSLRTQAADLSREEEVEVLFRDLAAREGRRRHSGARSGGSDPIRADGIAVAGGDRSGMAEQFRHGLSRAAGGAPG